MFKLRVLLCLIFILYKFSLASQSAEKKLTDGCKIEYGCYVEPKDCEESTSCNYVVKWKDYEDRTDFEINAHLTNSTSRWFAIGFSYDQEMGNDDVSCCYFTENNATVYHLFNTGHSRPIPMNSGELNLGFSNMKLSSNDGFLNCQFTRLKEMQNETNYFNLKQEFYLLNAQGLIDDSTGKLQYHRSNRSFSAIKINFQSKEIYTNELVNILKAKYHGALMIIAYIFMCSTGIIFARYFKNLFMNKLFFGVQFWFFMHRHMMLCIPILAVTALIIILSFNNWKWVSNDLNANFTHSIIGILTIILTFIQPFMAFFRPEKDAPYRSLFNWVHRILGITIFAIAMTTIYYGLIIFMYNDDRAWIIFSGWLLWIFVLFCLLEISEQMINHSLKEYILFSQADSINLKLTGNYQLIHFFKLGLLIAHLFITIGIVVTLILFVFKNNSM